MFNRKLKEEILELRNMVVILGKEIDSLKEKVIYEVVSEYSLEYFKRLWASGEISGTTRNIYNKNVISLILNKMNFEIAYEPERTVVSPADFKLVKKE